MIKGLKRCFISCPRILNVADRSLIARLISKPSLLTSKSKSASLATDFKSYISPTSASLERMRSLFSSHMAGLARSSNLAKLFSLSLSLPLPRHPHFILSYLASLAMAVEMLLKSLVLVQSWLLEHSIDSWWTFWGTSVIWHTEGTGAQSSPDQWPCSIRSMCMHSILRSFHVRCHHGTKTHSQWVD